MTHVASQPEGRVYANNYRLTPSSSSKPRTVSFGEAVPTAGYRQRQRGASVTTLFHYSISNGVYR